MVSVPIRNKPQFVETHRRDVVLANTTLYGAGFVGCSRTKFSAALTNTWKGPATSRICVPGKATKTIVFTSLSERVGLAGFCMAES